MITSPLVVEIHHPYCLSFFNMLQSLLCAAWQFLQTMKCSVMDFPLATILLQSRLKYEYFGSHLTTISYHLFSTELCFTSQVILSGITPALYID